jgi:hypothetical protein
MLIIIVTGNDINTEIMYVYQMYTMEVNDRSDIIMKGHNTGSRSRLMTCQTIPDNR